MDMLWISVPFRHWVNKSDTNIITERNCICGKQVKCKLKITIISNYVFIHFTIIRFSDPSMTQHFVIFVTPMLLWASKHFQGHLKEKGCLPEDTKSFFMRKGAQNNHSPQGKWHFHDICYGVDSWCIGQMSTKQCQCQWDGYGRLRFLMDLTTEKLVTICNFQMKMKDEFNKRNLKATWVKHKKSCPTEKTE